MRLIRQRFTNDCALASVAMVTRIPYERVLTVAKTKGFVPNSDNGMVLSTLLWALDIDHECDPYIPSPGERGRRPLPLRQPFIANAESLNNRGGYHAFVVFQGRVFDPSPKKTFDFPTFMLKRRHLYHSFRREATS